MKRFRRLAVLITAGLSLALFLANLGLWVRSYSIADVLMHLQTDKPPGVPTTRPITSYTGRQILAFASMRGRVQIGYTKESYSSFSLVPDGWKRASMPTRLVANAPTASWAALGFNYHHYAVPASVVVTLNGTPIQNPASAAPLVEAWTLWVPCWFLALVTAIDPAIWLWSFARRRRGLGSGVADNDRE